MTSNQPSTSSSADMESVVSSADTCHQPGNVPVTLQGLPQTTKWRSLLPKRLVTPAKTTPSALVGTLPGPDVQSINVAPGSLVEPEGLESLLQQFSAASYPGASTADDLKPTILVEVAEDKQSKPTSTDTAIADDQGSGEKSCSVEDNLDPSVVKKTIVEAFVKMVVCRKISVETLDVKTGAVLDTQVETQEEEPVILGVDCVQTTEDVKNSLDGGLKFLSAVSEGRQKISKSLVKNVSVGIGQSSKIVKEETLEETHVDLNEALDDEDFVPSTETKISSSSNSKTAPKEVTKQLSSDPVVILPKKRGRKRKWNNALGLAFNARSCQFCNKQLKNVVSCARHMKKGTCVSSVFCFICSKSLSNEQELESHLASHGQEAKTGVFECRDCHRLYRTKTGYTKHFNQGTCQRRREFESSFPGDFKCELCDSSFSSQDYLQLHRYKVHENPKDRHNCPDCGKLFYSWQGFQKHRNTPKSCTEPLKCKVCGKTYSNKARESFKIHMQHHKAEVSGITFNCEECGRSYMTQMALNKHKLSHTGVKPYKCDVCGKDFPMRYMVKDHARMHTGERPFLCNLCGTAFSNKGHLARHLRSHENGTLLKRGRPKKAKDSDESSSQETGLKMIDISESIQDLDGRSIQVVNGELFDTHTKGTPMIIQADNNTIIIAEGWPDAVCSGQPITIHNVQDTPVSILPANTS